MRELRLAPCALVAWAMVIAVTLGCEVWFTALVAAGVVALWIRGVRGQAVLIGGAGALALVTAATRRARWQAFEAVGEITGRIVARPAPTDAGGWYLKVQIPGYPTQVPMFAGELSGDAAVGSVVTARARAVDADRTSLSGIVLNARSADVKAPRGLYAWADGVAANFRGLVEQWVGEASQGLLPGMVLGDTSLQTAAEKQLYIDTGLSHLSAVSGANITIVTASAAVIASWCAFGPRGQFAAALAALGAYVLLVGPEPSVLRAAVTGVAGLCAVVGSARMEPMHALSLSVFGLVLWRSDLAVDVGFALSVAATAGIVALSPLLIRALGRTRLPASVVRALAVAIAADAVTIPIVALMAGEVSVISVLANVLVAPAAAPVTLVGLIAALCAQLPAPLAAVAVLPVKVIEPCTWWIHFVARACMRLPVDKIAAGPLAVAVAYGWVAAGLMYARPRSTAAVTVAAVALLAGRGIDLPRGAREIELTDSNTVVVQREEDIDTRGPYPGIVAIIVTGDGGDTRPRDRPSVTRAGVAVLYPERDGEVRVFEDGTQRAADGHF